MQQKLDEIERDLEAMNDHLNAITELVKSAYATRSFPVMRATHELMKEESRELERKAHEINRKFEDLQEKNRMKRVGLLALTLIVLLFVSSFVVAQDTPTPEVTEVIAGTSTLVSSEPIPTEAPAPVETEQPPVIVVNPPPVEPAPEPSDRLLLVLGLLGFAVISAISQFLTTKQVGSVLSVVNKTLENKHLIDEAHERYMQASLSTQQFINVLEGVAVFLGTMNIPILDETLDKAGEFLGNVTKGDTSSPTTPPGPLAGEWKPQYPVDDPGTP